MDSTDFTVNLHEYLVTRESFPKNFIPQYYINCMEMMGNLKRYKAILLLQL